MKIDEEFKNLVPSITKQEFFELQRSIRREGVQSPIIIWHDTIIDGHSRYEICERFNIDCPVRNIEFTDRDDAKMWILKHQLSKRNLTAFQKNEIVINNEKLIATQMAKNGESGRTCIVMAKIAGTSTSSVNRSKAILAHGTKEQIERARRGGFNEDGVSNSIATIADEVMGTKNGCRTLKKNIVVKTTKEFESIPLIQPKEEWKVCNCCKKKLPLSEFGTFKKGDKRMYRGICKKCHNAQTTIKNIKGKAMPISNLSMTEEALTDYLYNTDREIDYTVNDLVEEIKANGKSGINSIQSSLEIHKDLMHNEVNKQLVREAILALADTLTNLVKE